jgi:hypothetical protein
MAFAHTKKVEIGSFIKGTVQRKLTGVFKFKGTKPVKNKIKISGDNRGDHKLSIDTTQDPC